MISISLVFLLCVLFYYYLIKYKYSYWARMGVKGPTPLPIVGNCGKFMMMQQSIGELARKAYVQYSKEKVVGLYCGLRKMLVIRDPCIIKHILAKDFKCFMGRGVRTSEEGFCNNLLIAEGNIWKTLRQKLTPAFTSTKLKQMYPLMKECVDKLITETEDRMERGNPCNIKDLSEKYSLDIICSCIFGLSLDVYCNEIKHFGAVAKVAIQPSVFFWFWYVAEMIFPGIQSKFVKISPGSYLRSFFMKLVTTIIDERESRGIKRNDMMNILIDLKAQDKIKVGSSSLEIIMDNRTIASQALVFYVAGQDTSASVLTFLLYELSLHPEVQDKVYSEICIVCEKYNGDLTYDCLKEMNYLYMVFRETMRRHPAVGYLFRQGDSDYNIPESKITIKAGTLLMISITGLHNDVEYFKNPETFNPDNFSEENMSKIPQYAYVPFGAGPRNCIGFRLAEMLILMAVATIVKNFILEPCNDENYKIRFNTSNCFTLSPIGGIWACLSRRVPSEINS